MLIGKYIKNINPKFKNHYFSGLSFNSKTCKKNNIFFAIKGTEKDGNNFIEDAIKKGARTIVSNKISQGIKEKILYLKVKNFRKTLSEISYKIYKNKPKNLIAVTGTNGKSSVVGFYHQILKFNNINSATIGTLGIKTNSRKIPVFNTTLDPILLGKQLEKLKKNKVDNVILEASSHGLKQNRLDGLNFKIAIFTNLSHDHLDYHKTFKSYLNSKMYLFNKLLKKNSYVIADNTIPEFAKIKKISSNKKLNLISIGSKKCNLKIISHKYMGQKQFINIKYKNNFYKLETNLIGKIQIKNILMAMIAAEKNNIKFNKIARVVKKLKSIDGRFENIGVIKNNSKVILDYAHTPDALEICLQNLKDQFKYSKISIVFGCGGNRDKLKRPIMGKTVNKYCDKIYLTDDNPRKENPKKIRSEIKSKIYNSKLFEIPNREKAIKKAIFNLRTGEILVVAGKGHENIQDYGSRKKFFSDKKCILKQIAVKNKNLSKDIKLNILKEESKQNQFLIKKKIRKASINSKEVKKNDVFFAIKGKNKDGNSYVKEAFNKGASLAVVNRINKKENITKQIKVANSLNFLTRTSSIVRNNALGRIIAITGSCGKTSLKELISKTLSRFYHVTHSPKSFNNKYGVPLSLFNLNLKDDFGVFEVAMEKKGEINNLTKTIKPNIGVITNISYAHARNFKNLKQIALAKSEIINNISTEGSIVLNADDKFFKLHSKIALRKKLNIYSFSMNKKDATVRLNSIKKYKSKYKVFIVINNKKKYFIIPSNFENNLKNLLAAITVISIFKNVHSLNKNIFYNYNVPEGRGDISNIKIDNKNIFLIDESYNSNPLSLSTAIKNFDSIYCANNKKFLILGDMLELGKHSKKLHKKLVSIINSSSISNVSVYGKYVKETFKKINKNKKGYIFTKTSQIIDLIKNNINNNDYLMIKGSNSTGLHHIVSSLKRRKRNVI